MRIKMEHDSLYVWNAKSVDGPVYCLSREMPVPTAECRWQWYRPYAVIGPEAVRFIFGILPQLNEVLRLGTDGHQMHRYIVNPGAPYVTHEPFTREPPQPCNSVRRPWRP